MNEIGSSSVSIENCIQSDNITCIGCGSTYCHLIIKQEQQYEAHFMEAGTKTRPIISSKWTEEELSIISWVFQTFRIKSSTTNSWNCDSEPFPFCVRCKLKLKILLDLQLKLNDLRKMLNDGINEFKLSMGLAEKNFSCDVYEKDQRYKILRRQILRRRANDFAGKQKTSKLILDLEETMSSSCSIISNQPSSFEKIISEPARKLRMGFQTQSKSFAEQEYETQGCSVNDNQEGIKANKDEDSHDITGAKRKTRQPHRHPNSMQTKSVLKNCKICGKPSFRSAYDLELHSWTHFNEEEKKNIEARGELPFPVRTFWLQKKRWQCEECGLEFRLKKPLERHKQVSHGDEEQRQSLMELCPHCGKSFLKLKKHLERCQPNKERKYPCGVCGKTFYDNQAQRKHRNQVHQQFIRYLCKLCPKPKGFSQKDKYESHMNGHLNIRKFQCDKCSSAFTTKTHLHRHHKIFHEEGGNPKRNTYIRGMTKKVNGNAISDKDSMMASCHELIFKNQEQNQQSA